MARMHGHYRIYSSGPDSIMLLATISRWKPPCKHSETVRRERSKAVQGRAGTGSSGSCAAAPGCDFEATSEGNHALVPSKVRTSCERKDVEGFGRLLSTFIFYFSIIIDVQYYISFRGIA